MEEIIKRIIRLNVELEGALRVVLERKSDEAMSSAKDKFDEMSRLFASLGNKAVEETVEVKEDDAEGAEEAPLPEPTVEEVPDGAVVETDADAAVEADAAKAEAETETVVGTSGSVANKVERTDIRKAFTLNDKFLFRRELFGGNDAEFNDTLDLIESMGSLQEAEEYLYDDLQWNAEDDTVSDFMNIIGGYFAQQSR